MLFQLRCFITIGGKGGGKYLGSVSAGGIDKEKSLLQDKSWDVILHVEIVQPCFNFKCYCYRNTFQCNISEHGRYVVNKTKYKNYFIIP